MLDVCVEQMQSCTLLELLKRILQQKLHEQIPFFACFWAHIITAGTLISIVPSREIFVFVEDKRLAVALRFLRFRAIPSMEF